MTTTTTTRHRSITRWVVAGLTGLAAAATVGGVAAWTRDDTSGGVTFAVFAAMTLPFFVMLVAVVLDRAPHPEQDEDSIESQWTTRASSGAFYDTMIVMGLATFVTSVFDVTSVPVWAFALLGLADMGTRLVLLQRRES